MADLSAALEQFVEAYRDEPVLFAKNVLGFEPLPWQEEFLGLLAKGERRISVRAGHGVGKSAVCAVALIWHMMTRMPQKSVCTAPTAGQLFDALFSEVKHWANRLPDPLRESIDVFTDRIISKGAPESSFISARTSSAERPEALAGVHSEHVLLICDEASAIPEAVFESAAGSMSGHEATTVLIGNPTRNTGLFFKTHHQLSSDWKTLHVSCLDNPLVSRDFIEQIKATYGEGSNAFRVRVLGEFALRDDDSLIAADLVDTAQNRDIVLNADEPLVYGVDVARFGSDRTVIFKRRGNVALGYKFWSGEDLMGTVGRIVHEASIDHPYEICVDSIGLGGGVADRLRELGHNV
ncbi:MAG: terminase B, partial [Methylocystaceae bacterium]|nr:terminase B [Methylocystaceae bacterium]